MSPLTRCKEKFAGVVWSSDTPISVVVAPVPAPLAPPCATKRPPNDLNSTSVSSSSDKAIAPSESSKPGVKNSKYLTLPTTVEVDVVIVETTKPVLALYISILYACTSVASTAISTNSLLSVPMLV